MAALLRRAEQEDAEHADAALQRALRDEEGRVARNLARSDQGKVVWLARCQ
jgi:hypothetical protein